MLLCPLVSGIPDVLCGGVKGTAHPLPTTGCPLSRREIVRFRQQNGLPIDQRLLVLAKVFEQRSQFASRCEISGAEHERIRQLLQLSEPIFRRSTRRARNTVRLVIMLGGHVPNPRRPGGMQLFSRRLRTTRYHEAVAGRVPLLNWRKELDRNVIYRGVTAAVRRCEDLSPHAASYFVQELQFWTRL